MVWPDDGTVQVRSLRRLAVERSVIGSILINVVNGSRQPGRVLARKARTENRRIL